MTMPFSLPSGVFSLGDYEALAHERLDPAIWAYIAGGAADERTIAWNREAFDRIALQGRVLVDMAHAHTRLSLFGHDLDHPILLAPVALQKLVHPGGEREAAQAAAAMRTVMVVSTEASLSLEEIGRAAPGAVWFQLYVQRDRGFTRELIHRATAAGFRGLMLTVDAPVAGPRNRQQRAGYRPPAGVSTVNLEGMPTHQAAQGHLTDSPLFGGFLSGAATWKDVEWLRAETALPLVLKGISSPDDAEQGLSRGVSGLAISNHGGRTLDTLPASIDLLPRIAERIAGRIPLLLDGGIRRGTDVLKALALGASAVMIGRPYIHGLSVAGALGVAHVLHILRSELEMAMVQTGCPTLASVTRDVIW